MAIKTRKEFETWLRAQSQETCVLFVMRAALRGFPFTAHISKPSKEQKHLALSSVRAILTSGVSAKMPTPKVRAAADAAYALSAADAVDAVAYAAYPAVYPVAAGAVACTATLAAANADTDIRFEDLFQTALWHQLGEPDWLASALITNSNLLESGPEWSFWREWYQGFLDGKPMDWKLQRRVALIDDAIWEAGPEKVAEEIERIRAAFEVETRAGDLREAAFVAAAPSRGIGDNNPPDSIDDAVKTQDGVTIIWAAARDLEEEAASDTPNLERVKKAIGAIIGVMKAAGIWAAKKVDKALTAFVVTVGAAGGTASVAWLTQNSDKIGELIEAAERWWKLMQ
ncbi:hypothetical protein [Roseovarius sp. 2305UL8-3]|uniref:hypothetical protein n=1 Tax=Roseovarius conchicola TaxID=3121636 RepID=UPI003527A2DE